MAGEQVWVHIPKSRERERERARERERERAREREREHNGRALEPGGPNSPLMPGRRRERERERERERRERERERRTQYPLACGGVVTLSPLAVWRRERERQSTQADLSVSRFCKVSAGKPEDSKSVSTQVKSHCSRSL